MTLAADGDLPPRGLGRHVAGASGLEVLAPVVGRRRSPPRRAPAADPARRGGGARADPRARPSRSPPTTRRAARLGERLAHDVGGSPFRLADERRPLYHAAAVFASNYVVTAAGVAEELFREAGVPDPVAALLPLAPASLENVARLGPADGAYRAGRPRRRRHRRAEPRGPARGRAARRRRLRRAVPPRAGPRRARRAPLARGPRRRRGGAVPLDVIRDAAGFRAADRRARAAASARRRVSSRRWAPCTPATSRCCGGPARSTRSWPCRCS